MLTSCVCKIALVFCVAMSHTCKLPVYGPKDGPYPVGCCVHEATVRPSGLKLTVMTSDLGSSRSTLPVPLATDQSRTVLSSLDDSNCESFWLKVRLVVNKTCPFSCDFS